MKALIQRVTRASVSVDKQVVGSIEQGLLVLLGVEKSDSLENVAQLCRKILNYRVFSDQDGKMNHNVQQVDGSILLVSQFTLVADTRKGNRPGFSKGASPDLGEALYHAFVEQIARQYKPCQTGIFGADMQVELCNDGPVTFMLESNC